MSKGKGKEAVTKPDWKDKLAELDLQFGWDEESAPDWSETCQKEDQQLTDSGNNDASQELADNFDDDETISPEMQGRICDTSLEGPVSSGRDQADTAQQQHAEDDEVDERWETEEEQHDESSDSEYDEEEEIQPKSRLASYLYHRFGYELRYEDRCSCCEFLVDRREEKRKRDRNYFAEMGGSCLIMDSCALLPFKQEDVPGTENVDKPVLMVTTPDGEELYPHDLEEYPDPPAAPEDESLLRITEEIEDLVPYDEEDTPDD